MKLLLRIIQYGVIGLWGLLIVGCEKQFNATDVTRTSLGTQLKLQNTNGESRTIQDYSGKVVLVFFGFIQCPDICPTSMLKAQEVLQFLGQEKAAQVQVLFVTIDPERDVPNILRDYVQGYDERFEGLWGSLEQTQVVANDFRVHYKKVFTDKASNSYTMEHTASMYMFDPKGNLRLLVGYQISAEKIAEDVRRLLNELDS